MTTALKLIGFTAVSAFVGAAAIVGFGTWIELIRWPWPLS